MFWSSGFGVAPCTGFLVLLELEKSFSSRCVWSCSSRQQYPEANRAFSCRLTWEYPTSDLEAACQLFPEAIATSFRSSAFPGLTGYTKFCEEFLSLHGLRDTKLSGLAFAGTVGLGFAIGEPSFEVASWPLFDMALCFADPIGRKKVTEMATREYWETHNVEQTKKIIPPVTRKTSFG